MKYLNISKHSFSKLLAATLCMSTLAGCNNDEFLQEIPLDFVSAEGTYTDASKMTMGINAMHRLLRDAMYWGANHEVATMGDAPTFYSHLTDVSFYGENPAHESYLDITPGSSAVSYLWTQMFRLISAANELLYYTDYEFTTGWESEEQKKLIQSECLFFRAYAYRLLTSYYGDVPLLTESVSSPKIDFVRTPVAEIYTQLENDLQFAVQHLPNPGSEAAKGRVTKGAAYQLLNQICLQAGHYQQAIDAATHVINDFGYHLMTERFGFQNDVFGTGDVFLDLFAYSNQNNDSNKEAIWVAQIAQMGTGGGYNMKGAIYGPRYWEIGVDPDGKDCILGNMELGEWTHVNDTLGYGRATCRPTYHTSHEIWSSDWENDIRNAPHNIKRDFYFQNPESKYDGMKIDFSLWTEGRNSLHDTCSYIFPYWIGKVNDPCHILLNYTLAGAGNTYQCIYFMRLAETYLDRAEAYIQLGNMQKAADDINVVRTRAQAKPITANEVTMDYLLDERIRELYTEEVRDVVLRRTGKLLERVRKYNNNPMHLGLEIKDHNVLWPIPLGEIDASAGSLTQNSGY